MYLQFSSESPALRLTLAKQYVQRSDQGGEGKWAESNERKSLENGISSLRNIDGGG